MNVECQACQEVRFEGGLSWRGFQSGTILMRCNALGFSRGFGFSRSQGRARFMPSAARICLGQGLLLPTMGNKLSHFLLLG